MLIGYARVSSGDGSQNLIVTHGFDAASIGLAFLLDGVDGQADENR